jgi:hypothetical protein
MEKFLFRAKLVSIRHGPLESAKVEPIMCRTRNARPAVNATGGAFLHHFCGPKRRWNRRNATLLWRKTTVELP